MKFRTGGAVLAAALVVAGLTAGTSSVSAHHREKPVTVTVPAAAAAAAPSRAWTESTYLASVRAAGAGTTVTDQSDAYLVDSGKSLCADIAAGATAATFARQVYDNGVDAARFKKLLRAAVLTYCPNRSSILR